MNKKFSLLYKEPEPSCEKDPQLQHNLLLENALLKLHSNAKSVRYFLNVLASPPNKDCNALHRGEILQDFHEHPMSMNRLLACLKTLDSLPEQYQKERSMNKASAAFGSDARFLTSAKQVLLSACTLSDIFERLNEIYHLLKNEGFKASGFCALYERLDTLFSSEDYTTLTTLLNRLMRLPEDYKIELQFTLSELGRLQEYDILSIESMELVKVKKKGLKRLFQSAEQIREAESYKEYQSILGIPVKTATHQLRNQTIGGVYEKIAETLNLMIQGLFSEFCGMSSEFHFYYVALSILTFFEKNEVEFCYPQFTTGGLLEFQKLSDFVLLCEFYGEKTVVKNDASLSFERPGILISGENNSGKTVYLRSIATALLFAKNGLPIPANSATISEYGKVITMFATGEKSASIGTGAGRFEEEVSTMSAIVNTLKSGDILFLNEVFQTTSYAEGAEGLFHILKHLEKRGIRWVCVSHLTELFSLFNKNETTMLQTADPASEKRYQLFKI